MQHNKISNFHSSTAPKLLEHIPSKSRQISATEFLNFVFYKTAQTMISNKCCLEKLIESMQHNKISNFHSSTAPKLLEHIPSKSRPKYGREN
jgi:hypothetical protein